MSLKRTVLVALLLAAVLPSTALQGQDRRAVLEESVQGRYRLTILGGGPMGIRGGDNAIRRVGGIVMLEQDGMYAAYDRRKLSSNAIRNGKAEVVSGSKDVALARGERFYVTAVYVGSDVVTLGLLSTRMIPGGSKPAQVWATANFFFSEDTLAQGDLEKVYAVIDPWLIPEEAAKPAGTASVAAASAIAAASSSSAVSAAPAVPAAVTHASHEVDLKPGMSRDEVVSVLGAPLQEAGFGDHRWLTYAGMTVTLEQGKLTSVDRNAQALVPVRVSSDPAGADVFLDGSFVSSAPAVLRLRAGSYKVVVKMAGYGDWEREVKILAGSEVSLDARLSK
jgi:hypothetical protein